MVVLRFGECPFFPKVEYWRGFRLESRLSYTGQGYASFPGAPYRGGVAACRVCPLFLPVGGCVRDDTCLHL
jgi:hypothetical protein